MICNMQSPFVKHIKGNIKGKKTLMAGPAYTGKGAKDQHFLESLSFKELDPTSSILKAMECQHKGSDLTRAFSQMRNVEITIQEILEPVIHWVQETPFKLPLST